MGHKSKHEYNLRHINVLANRRMELYSRSHTSPRVYRRGEHSGHYSGHPLRNGILLGFLLPTIICLCIYILLQAKNKKTTGESSFNTPVNQYPGGANRRSRWRSPGGLFLVVIATGHGSQEHVEAVNDTWGQRATSVRFLMDGRTSSGIEGEERNIVTIPKDIGANVLHGGRLKITFSLSHVCRTMDPGSFTWFLLTSQLMYVNTLYLQRHLLAPNHNTRNILHLTGSQTNNCMTSPGFFIPGSVLKDMCRHMAPCVKENSSTDDAATLCLIEKVGATCQGIPKELVHFAKAGNQTVLDQLRDDSNFTRRHVIFTGPGLTSGLLHSVHQQVLLNAMKDRFKLLDRFYSVTTDTLSNMDVIMTIGGPSKFAYKLVTNATFSSSSCDGATPVSPDNKRQLAQTLSSIHSYLISSGDLKNTSTDSWYDQSHYYTGKTKQAEFMIHGFKLYEDKKLIDIGFHNKSFHLTRVEINRHHDPQRILKMKDFLWPETVWILLPVSTKQHLKIFSTLWKELKYRTLNLSIKVLLLHVKQEHSLFSSANFPRDFYDKSIYNVDGELRQIIPHTSLSSTITDAYQQGVNYINGIYRKHRRKNVVVLFSKPMYTFSFQFLRRCVSLAAAGMSFAPLGKCNLTQGRNIGDVDTNIQIGFAEELLEDSGAKYAVWRSGSPDLRCVGLEHLPMDLNDPKLDSIFQGKRLTSRDPDLLFNV